MHLLYCITPFKTDFSFFLLQTWQKSLAFLGGVFYSPLFSCYLSHHHFYSMSRSSLFSCWHDKMFVFYFIQNIDWIEPLSWMICLNELTSQLFQRMKRVELEILGFFQLNIQMMICFKDTRVKYFYFFVVYQRNNPINDFCLFFYGSILQEG